MLPAIVEMINQNMNYCCFFFMLKGLVFNYFFQHLVDKAFFSSSKSDNTSHYLLTVVVLYSNMLWCMSIDWQIICHAKTLYIQLWSESFVPLKKSHKTILPFIISQYQNYHKKSKNCQYLYTAIHLLFSHALLNCVKHTTWDCVMEQWMANALRKELNHCNPYLDSVKFNWKCMTQSKCELRVNNLRNVEILINENCVWSVLSV